MYSETAMILFNFNIYMCFLHQSGDHWLSQPASQTLTAAGYFTGKFPSATQAKGFRDILVYSKDASFFRVTLRKTNQCLTMALFRRFHRMFRRRLCLLFVLVWIATVFLCGLEVMKFKTMLKKNGKDCKFTAFAFREEATLYVSGIAVAKMIYVLQQFKN